ncbi:MAG TPA: nucleotide-binding protein [Methylomirabilota bacterium]|nr:nucleotide-binding protein [Methylomirabilota bacterium]
MQKTKVYRRTKFDSATYARAEKKLHSLASQKIGCSSLKVTIGGDEWTFDTLEEFLAAADQGPISFTAAEYDRKIGIHAFTTGDGVVVEVWAPTREKIESIFAVFEAEADRCRLPEKEEKRADPKIFIGHGNDPQWRDLKDHLHDKHGYAVEAYEIGSRAGHTIRDILETMLIASTFALLVMTGEDETKDGKILARQNVVHEAGLFQGRLGFGRAIVLLEAGTEEFSNIHGLEQIRFSKGNIKESFGDVVAALKQEFG